MPLLSKEDRDRMLGPTTQKCLKCNIAVQKNYCRQHDEFFFLCKCQQRPDDHSGHRTYVCETDGCINVLSQHCFACDKHICEQCAASHDCTLPPHAIGQEECECLLLGS